MIFKKISSSKPLRLLPACFWIILASCFFSQLHAQGSDKKANEMDLLENQRILDTGDPILYRVIEERKPSPDELFVNNEGMIDAPLIGYVPARDKTPRELAFDIKERLEKRFFHNATVIIELRRQNTRGKVNVLGKVNRPGQYNIPTDKIMRVSDAILKAGNFTQNASQSKVTLIRQDPENENAELRFIVDVGGILQTGAYEHDMAVKPDDLIIVPQRKTAGGQVYINGEVRSPGLYPIPSGKKFTVSRAILAAGGFTEWAVKDKVKLIKNDEELSPEERTLVVDVEKILQQNVRSFDPEVEADDVIVIDEAFFKF